MKTILMMAGLGLLFAPLATFAAVYHYVDTNHVVRDVNAPNASAALQAAVNIAPHSGVTLDTGVLDAGDTVTGTGSVSTGNHAGMHQYHYVDTTGTVRTVYAANAAAAYALAVNLAPHSGVTLDTGVLDSGDSVTGG